MGTNERELEDLKRDLEIMGKIANAKELELLMESNDHVFRATICGLICTYAELHDAEPINLAARIFKNIAVATEGADVDIERVKV